MKDVKKILIREIESCIKTLDVYINDEEVTIVSPSIVVDDGYDQNLSERRGKVSYWEVEETDEAFKNYCSGLMGLSFNPRLYAEKYVQLINKFDNIFDERKT